MSFEATILVYGLAAVSAVTAVLLLLQRLMMEIEGFAKFAIGWIRRMKKLRGLL